MRATRTSELRVNHGLVDYIADGILGTDKIPCEIGYCEFTDLDGFIIIRATHVFIKNDGVTESGNHYYKETINLLDNCYVDIEDEEV